jgi:hypothetical protein
MRTAGVSALEPNNAGMSAATFFLALGEDLRERAALDAGTPP